MMWVRKHFLLVLFFLIILVACDQHPSSEINNGDTLMMATSMNLAPLNPLTTVSSLSAVLNDIIFDSLVRLDEHFEAKPHLAHSWRRSEDGLVWTFYLRPGVKFHDGVELTAEDVVFTLEKMRDLQGKSIYTFFISDVQSIRMVDRYTLEITLNKPLAPFLELLQFGVLPKHLLENEDPSMASFNQRPVGTGSFKPVYWSENEALLEAYDDYFLGRPHLDQIRVLVYPNEETALAKLIAGEVDYAGLLPPTNYQILKKLSTINLYSYPRHFYYMIAFNMNDPIFKDKRVRQALNYAVNKEEIINRVLMGQGQVASGTINPESWAYNPEVKPYGYDPKKAINLLKEAGWEDHDGDHFLDREGRPFEFTVHVPSGFYLEEKAFLYIEQYLMDIGIKIKVRFFDASNLEFLFNKQFQSFFVDPNAGGDPDYSYTFWHSSQIRAGSNMSSYRNPKVDQWLDAGRTELDTEKRKAIYFEYQNEFFDNPPGIFLFWEQALEAIHHRFRGVRLNAVESLGIIREWYVPKAEQRYVREKNRDE